MGNHSPKNAIRPLGSFEHFFEAAHDLFGSLRVAGVYKLTQPTNLENIRHAATYLRARHQILQCSVSFNWDTKAAHYIKADHLALHIDHHADERTTNEYVQQLVDGDFAPGAPDEERRRVWRARCEKYLPWTIALIGRGDQVCFVGPHSICDGISLDVVGGDVVRALNGQDATDFLPIAQPVEPMFGNVNKWAYVKTFLKMITHPNTVEAMGLDTRKLPRDWRARKSIGKTLHVTLEDIAPFFTACREQKVSLTSGIISTLYEVLGRRPGLTVGTEQVAVNVAMDCRRRVDDTSMISLDQVGAYAGSCKVLEDGAAGDWAPRAKRVHRAVHSANNWASFAELGLQAGMGSKLGRMFFEKFVNGKPMGRLFAVGVSNIGECTRIESANEECQRLASEGAQVVQIERMRFDNSQVAFGGFINICIATVGQNVAVHIASCEPFFSQQVLNEILDGLEEEICRVTDQASQGVALVEV